MFIIQWFLAYSLCCTTNSRTFPKTPKESLYLLSVTSQSPAPRPCPWNSTDLLPMSMDLPILEISRKWSHITCGFLCLASFTDHNVFEVHLPCSLYQCFLSYYGPVMLHRMAVTHFVYPFRSRWTFGLFPFSGHCELMLLWTSMYKLLCGHVFSSLGHYITRSGVAGSHCNSVYSIFGNCQTIFHSRCPIWYSHQPGTRAPFSLHLHQHLVFSIWKILPISVGVTSYLTEVLICTSLITMVTSIFSRVFGCLCVVLRNIYWCPLPGF